MASAASGFFDILESCFAAVTTGGFQQTLGAPKTAPLPDMSPHPSSTRHPVENLANPPDASCKRHPYFGAEKTRSRVVVYWSKVVARRSHE